MQVNLEGFEAQPASVYRMYHLHSGSAEWNVVYISEAPLGWHSSLSPYFPEPSQEGLSGKDLGLRCWWIYVLSNWNGPGPSQGLGNRAYWILSGLHCRSGDCCSLHGVQIQQCHQLLETFLCIQQLRVQCVQGQAFARSLGEAMLLVVPWRAWARWLELGERTNFCNA